MLQGALLIICFLPVSASFSGDGASSVGRAPSPGAHEVGLLLREKVMLRREGGKEDPVLVLGTAGESCQMSVSQQGVGAATKAGDGDSGGWRMWEAGTAKVSC